MHENQPQLIEKERIFPSILISFWNWYFGLQNWFGYSYGVMAAILCNFNTNFSVDSRQ